MADIKGVAARAGVSVATVSRVMSGASRVSPQTRSRVLAAIAELDYRPNAVARSLRTDSTHSLGLIIGDIVNPFFTGLARAVEDEARAAGYTVVVGNADERADQQDHYIRVLLEQRVDGLLVSPAAETTPMMLAAAGSGTPLVLVDRVLPGLAVPSVRTDGAEATHDFIRHVHRLGHRRIAFISGPDTLSTGRERTEAFLAAMAEYGLDVPREYIEAGDFQAASGRAITARFLDLPVPPSVILAGDNLMALGALQEIKARRLRIPRDVALGSFDDVPWFEHLDPPLTAIAQPVQRLGSHAVRRLLDCIQGRPVSSVVLRARLVARRSCGEQSDEEA